jgi:WD40 repeat protein
LNSDVNTIAQTAFIFQENQACQTNTLVDERKYWTRGRCYDVETFLDQIKLTSGGSFIYCPDHQINLDGHSQSCPNYVFSLPKGTNFVIGSYNYSSKVWLNAKNFSIVDHLRINSFIFPQTQKELSLIPGLEHLLKIIRDNDVWFFDSSDSWLPVVTYILPVLLILLAIMYLGYRLCRRCYANNELSAEARTLNIIAEHQPHIVATEEA